MKFKWQIDRLRSRRRGLLEAQHSTSLKSGVSIRLRSRMTRSGKGRSLNWANFQISHLQRGLAKRTWALLKRPTILWKNVLHRLHLFSSQTMLRCLQSPTRMMHQLSKRSLTSSWFHLLTQTRRKRPTQSSAQKRRWSDLTARRRCPSYRRSKLASMFSCKVIAAEV